MMTALASVDIICTPHQVSLELAYLSCPECFCTFMLVGGRRCRRVGAALAGGSDMVFSLLVSQQRNESPCRATLRDSKAGHWCVDALSVQQGHARAAQPDGRNHYRNGTRLQTDASALPWAQASKFISEATCQRKKDRVEPGNQSKHAQSHHTRTRTHVHTHSRAQSRMHTHMQKYVHAHTHRRLKISTLMWSLSWNPEVQTSQGLVERIFHILPSLRHLHRLRMISAISGRATITAPNLVYLKEQRHLAHPISLRDTPVGPSVLLRKRPISAWIRRRAGLTQSCWPPPAVVTHSSS